MDRFIRLLASETSETSETFEQSCVRLGSDDQAYFFPGVQDGRKFLQNDLLVVFSNRRFAKVREGFLAQPEAERRACIERETGRLLDALETSYACFADPGFDSYEPSSEPFSFLGNKLALTGWCWMAAEQGWGEVVLAVLERQEAINRDASARDARWFKGWVDSIATVEPVAALSCWVNVLRASGGDGPGIADRLLEAAGPRIIAEAAEWVGWRARVTPFERWTFFDGKGQPRVTPVDRTDGHWEAWVYKWGSSEQNDPLLREAVMAGFRAAAIEAAGGAEAPPAGDAD